MIQSRKLRGKKKGIAVKCLACKKQKSSVWEEIWQDGRLTGRILLIHMQYNQTDCLWLNLCISHTSSLILTFILLY